MHLSFKKIAGAFTRALLLGLAAYAASALTWDSEFPRRSAIELSGVVALVGILASTINPVIESATDAMPARKLGYLGIALIVAGMALQSVQYWVIVANIPTH